MTEFGLEVEFLTGVSVAAKPHRRNEAEWPPHPDRLFQALTAAWGRSEEPAAEERAALEWLEALPSDSFSILGPRPRFRSVAPVFVPPNDMQTSGKAGSPIPRNVATAVTVIPALRRNRQERFFPAAIPAAERPIVYYRWKLTDEQVAAFNQHYPALTRLAREVVYLGHSHSPVRVAVRKNVSDLQSESSDTVVYDGQDFRMPYPGRLAHLQAQYDRAMETNKISRPLPSLNVVTLESMSRESEPTTIFDGHGSIVLADRGGFVPTLAAFPAAAKRLRDALLRHGSGDERPLLSGRSADRRPADEAHVALFPLADVGWRYSSGHLLGLGVVFPRTATESDRAPAWARLATFLQADREHGARLSFGEPGTWHLGLEANPTRHSLRIERYFGPARRWATVLPMVLDRYPKPRPGKSVEDLVRQACLYIGLPDHVVRSMVVSVHQSSAVTGAPSVREVSRSLASDSPYRGRPLAHAVLEFQRDVRGPMLIGAGRFQGLGLCLPLTVERGGNSADG